VVPDFKQVEFFWPGFTLSAFDIFSYRHVLFRHDKSKALRKYSSGQRQLLPITRSIVIPAQTIPIQLLIRVKNTNPKGETGAHRAILTRRI
jgi:hypothetical protein